MKYNYCMDSILETTLMEYRLSNIFSYLIEKSFEMKA